MARGVVIALGNRDRGDDGAGLELLARLGDAATPHGVRLHTAGSDPLALLDLWTGADWAILLDSAVSGGPAGKLHRVQAAKGALAKDIGRFSTHGFGLREAVELGSALGRVPEQLVVYAIEGDCFDHGAALSPAVATALDDAVARVGQEMTALNET